MSHLKYDNNNRRSKRNLENGFSILTFLQNLAEADFTTQTLWDVTGKFAKANPMTLIFAAGDANGTLIQTLAKMTSPLVANTSYKYTYVVGVTDAPDGDFTLVLTGGFIDTEGNAVGIAMPFTAGTHTIYFQTGDIPANFTITALETTATQCSITLDTFSVTKILDNALDPTETEWFRLVALEAVATLSAVSRFGDDLPSVTMAEGQPGMIDGRFSRVVITAGTVAAYRI